MVTCDMGKRIGAGRVGAKRIRLLTIAVVMAAPATAMAHAYVMQPPSRDVGIANLDQRAHKTGPCGGSPRVGVPTQYTPGQPAQIKWEETIGHTGCYQIVFSAADDKNWITLKQINDPAGKTNGPQTTNVTIPNVRCESCTIAVRQLMLEGSGNTTCAPDAAPPPGDTYFSCADVRVGEFADAGPVVKPPPLEDAGPDPDDEDPGTGSGDEDGTSSGSSGSSGKRLRPVEGAGTGACSVALGATSGMSFLATVGAGVIGLLRRRRRRSDQR